MASTGGSSLMKGEQSITLAVPPPGQTVRVQLEPQQVIEVPFSLDDVTVTVVGDDLRMDFPGGAVLVLGDFAAMIAEGVSPLLIFANGSVVAGDILLTALSVEIPVVAAGVSAASGGAGEYDDDMGSVIDGLDKLDTQDPDAPGVRLVTELASDEAAVTAPPTPDIDQAVTFAISADVESLSEELAQAATFSVSRSGGALSDGNLASVTIAASGSATGGTDYDPALAAAIATAAAATEGVTFDSATGRLTFTGSADSLTFSLTAVDDDAIEGPETIVATLSDAAITYGTAAIVTPSDAVTLTESDQAVSFAISADVESLSEELAQAATFTVSRSGGALSDGNLASVTIAASGSATGGTDYDPALAAAIATAAAATDGVTFDSATGRLTFTGSADTLTFSLAAVDDDAIEGPETIVATLSDAAITFGTAAIVTPSDAVTLTESDQAVSFAISVTSKLAANDTPGQQATLTEFGTSDDTATFTIARGGGDLAAGNTASVTITIGGSAHDGDFTGMSGSDYGDILLAIKSAAETAGLTVGAVTADSLQVTWAAGDPASFDVSLSAFFDSLPESTENLSLTLGNAISSHGTATLLAGQEMAAIDIDDYEPRILDGIMTTNSNTQQQFITLTFAETDNPLHAAAKVYNLYEQGQQGHVVQDVGFNIDPSKHYDLSIEAAGVGKAIVTDLTLEGVVIQGSGNATLELNNTVSTNSTSTAISTVIDPGDPPPVQAKTLSIDGDDDDNALTDTTTGTFTYLYGADGQDSLNGSDGQDVLNGGAGHDILHGGGGNDFLVYDALNNDYLDGGAGFDLLRVDQGALALSQLGSVHDSNTLGPGNNVLVDLTGKDIHGIEGILITEEAGTSTTAIDPNDDVGTTVRLNAQDVLDYSETDTLYILGSPGDVVELGGGTWTSAGPTPPDPAGQQFELYTADLGGGQIASVFVETEVQVHTI